MVNRLRRAPAEVLRVEALSALLCAVRRLYPARWRPLVDAVRAARDDIEAINEAIWHWALEHRLADCDRLVVLAGWRVLFDEPALREVLGRGLPALTTWTVVSRSYAPVPRPVVIPLLAGWLSLGHTEAQLRHLLLAEAERLIDKAILELRRRPDELGFAAEPERRNEKEHAEWVVQHLVGRQTIASITEKVGVDERSVRRSISAMRRRAGLPVRRGTKRS